MESATASPRRTWRSLFVQSPHGAHSGAAVQALNWTLAVILLAAIFTFSFHQSIHGWRWDAVFRYREKLLNGWLVTIGISMVSLALRVVLGVALALARRRRVLLRRALARIYVEGIRGTPLLVQILFFFYVVA